MPHAGLESPVPTQSGRASLQLSEQTQIFIGFHEWSHCTRVCPGSPIPPSLNLHTNRGSTPLNPAPAPPPPPLSTDTHPPTVPKPEQFYPLLWRDVHVCPRIVWRPGHCEQPQWAQNTLPSQRRTGRDPPKRANRTQIVLNLCAKYLPTMLLFFGGRFCLDKN